MSVEPGTKGRFVIERLLGAQAPGRFFLAIDAVHGGRVTLFMPALDRVAPAKFVEQMQAEVERCRPLRGTPYCTLREVLLTEEGAACVVVERPQGTPLSALLRDQGHLNIDQALNIGVQLCDLLQRAHAVDIFPAPSEMSNVILDPQPDGGLRASLVDLALHRAAYGAGVERQIKSSLFLSPELRLKQPADPRDDVFAITALVHAMIFGVAPSAMSAHGPVDGSGWPSLPGQHLDIRLESCLHTILLKGLAQTRAERFPRVAALGRALIGLRQLMSISAPAFELLAATRGRMGRRGDPFDGLSQPRPALNHARQVRARINEVVAQSEQGSASRLAEPKL
ncbi:hypothetical protein KKF91_05605 [Myxococcota bacterium]|nr:hypothetical protein [Myxococcota bacterium]MBU1430025.1 hypothetical protein [Myxococcota bacterium]MBU1899422.1 hypothetical protein [Myxococcota bacterium]